MMAARKPPHKDRHPAPDPGHLRTYLLRSYLRCDLCGWRIWGHTVKTHTRGLEQDRHAVNAAVTLPYHNGGTEGVNTKTKRIMRQMHGRAGFALLRHRILLG